jgi:hypothetical protein
MGNIMTSKLSHSILLFTVIGDFLFRGYCVGITSGYNSKTMEMFQNTVLKYEGLWERLSLLCMSCLRK